MVIERADVGDATALVAMQRRAYQDPALPPLVESCAELKTAFETHGILKAVVDDAIVGSMGACCDDQLCAIGRLMVHPRLQRQGLGPALMRRIEAHVPGAERFQLYAGARSAANIRLYRRLGYAIAAEEPVNDWVSVVLIAKQAQPVRNGIGG